MGGKGLKIKKKKKEEKNLFVEKLPTFIKLGGFPKGRHTFRVRTTMGGGGVKPLPLTT